MQSGSGAMQAAQVPAGLLLGLAPPSREPGRAEAALGGGHESLPLCGQRARWQSLFFPG